MNRPRRHMAPPSAAARVLDHRPALLATLALTLAAIAALLLALPAHATGRISAQDLSVLPVSYTLSDSKVVLYNLAGVATLEPTSGTQVIVEVARGGADAGKLKVVTGNAEGRSSLAVIYPGTRIVYPQMGRGSNTQSRVRDDGTFGGRNTGKWSNGHSIKISGSGGGTEAHADLTLRIPKGADVVLRLAAGDVHVTNVDSKLMIDTGSGAVTSAGTRGALTIDTGSGSVSVSLESVIDDMDIDSGSGRVDVEVPRETGAMLSLETGSGSIDADAALTSVHRDHGELHAQMGNGRGRIVIETGAGGIRFAAH